MTAQSTTGTGPGAVETPTNHSLSRQINSIVPTGPTNTSTIELEIIDGIGSMVVNLKNSAGEVYTDACNIFFFLSTSATNAVFESSSLSHILMTIEVTGGEEDLIVLHRSFGNGARDLLVPSHSEDKVLRIELENIDVTPVSGFYCGILFQNSTFIISPSELLLPPGEEGEGDE